MSRSAPRGPLPPSEGGPQPERGQPVPGAGRLGMAVFLVSLSMLFAASMVGYLVVRLRAEAWPPPGMPRLPSGLWVATAVIVGCSVTIHRALLAARRGLQQPMVRWLGATLGLGALFLILQAMNWWGLITARMPMQANLYAFTFYMLTGLHAAHVIGGLIPLGVVTSKARRGAYSAGSHPGVEYSAMYWHFLDAVWLVMFATLLTAG
jgi:cytochrome c oxidase subunit III